MGVRLDASGDGVKRTANLPAATTAFTMTGWFKPVNLTTSTFQCLFGVENSDGSIWRVFGFNSSAGPPIRLSQPTGGSNAASAPTAGQRFFAFMKVIGGSFEGGWMAAGGTSFTKVTLTDAGSFTAVGYAWGTDPVSDEWCDTEVSHAKLWDVGLTDAELLNEAYATFPDKTASLNGYWPLRTTSDLKDYSGNGRDLTSMGTLANADDAPISDAGDIETLFFSSAALTGDLVITGSGGTVAMAGQAIDSGTLAITGSGGTVAMQGQAIASGTLGITGSGGTVAMAGTLTSAGTLGITGSGGTVTAYQEGPTVTAHASNRYLVDGTGNTFRIHGDAAYDLFVNLSLANLRTYLDDRRTRGYNTLLTQLTDPKKYHASSNAPAARGASDALPFLLNESATTWDGDPGFANFDADFSSPNDTYFSWCRQAVQEIGARNMVAIINPVYLGFNNGVADGWWQTLINTANTQTVCYNFGLYLADWFADLPNIIWSLGVDMFPAAASEGETRFGKVFLGLQDGGCTQPMIAHGKASSDSRDYNANLVSYVTLNGVYAHGDYGTPSTAHNAHGRARLAYAKTTPDMVCFHLEGMYEDGTDVTEHGASRQQLRSEHWGALLSTIGGTIFGNGDVWTFATHWTSSISSNGNADFEKIDDLLSSRSWHLLVPNGLGSIGTLITAGGGTAQTTGSVGSNDGNNGTDYVVAACTPDGTLMLCYEPDGHSGSFTVDMSKMSGSTTARWYDPTDGSFSTDGASPLAASGTHAFTNPGTNAGGDTDWVLVLEAGPTGTMAITGSGGTVAMAGTTDDVGSIGITGSGGTVAMLGTSPDTGTMDITGSGGTVAMAGTSNIPGTLGIVGSGGTVAASGTSNIVGTLAIGGSGGSVDARESAYSGQDDMFLIQ